MKKATNLLEYSSMSIKEIAYQLGYLNPSSFMKSFKKYTSLTPSQYRLHIKSNKKTVS